MHEASSRLCGVEPLAWWAVAVRVLRVVFPVVGVGYEIGVSAVTTALAVSRASAESIVVTAVVGSDGTAIAPLSVLVIRVECMIFIGVALGDVEELSDGDFVAADALQLGDEWLIATCPPEAVDRRVGADAA
jgi:nucleoside phosphorylase